MESVRVKSYAKLNLTLHITGTENGFHTLDSLVCSVDLFDLIKIRKRKDKLVSIQMRGCGSEGIRFEDNNAVKAAELFISAYGVNGADISVYKNIPMGLGMGGSSADAAGVLNGLASLYGTGDPAGLKLLADRVGSDVRYMLSGGYARLGGRGDTVLPVESKLKLHFLLLAPSQRVSTAECYRLSDSTSRFGGDSDAAVNALIRGDKAELAANMNNALLAPATRLSGEISAAYAQLEGFDPLAVNMTGSGSGVYALFKNAEYCSYAKSRYRGGFAAYCLKTVN